VITFEDAVSTAERYLTQAKSAAGDDAVMRYASIGQGYATLALAIATGGAPHTVPLYVLPEPGEPTQPQG